MPTIGLNNVRNNNAYIQQNVDDSGWNNFTTKAPSGKTTNITIVDAAGNTPTQFTSLNIRFLKKGDPTGSGKGDLRAESTRGANEAVVVLGKASGSPQYDACLTLELDNKPVATVFGYIDSTG